MTAVADGLTVAVEEVGHEDPEPMLTIGCSPRSYPLSQRRLARIKRDAAGPLGVAASNFVDLDFHFDTSAKRIQLLGLPIREYAQLSSRTDCQLIAEVREALGLSSSRDEPQVDAPTLGKSRREQPMFLNRVRPAYH